jgi:hypothetical protein
MVMTQDHDKDIDAIFREGTPIDRAMQAATRDAIKRHKQAGLPMLVWRDGQTVLMSPEELEAALPDDPSQPSVAPCYSLISPRTSANR